MSTKEKVKQLLASYSPIFMAIPGVTGTGVGGYDRFRIYVEDNHLKALLEQILTEKVDEIPIEVVVIGRVHIQNL
jgi:hypothetical protein